MSVLSFFLFVGCSNDEPCFPSSVGKQYRVTVVERWDQDSNYAGGQSNGFPCPATFDLAPGSTFDIQVDDFNAETTGCSCGRGKAIKGPAGWTWEPAIVLGACLSNFFQGVSTATNGSCVGEARIYIETSKVPTGNSILGQRPRASAFRTFAKTYSDGASTCPFDGHSCVDHFVVEIEQL